MPSFHRNSGLIGKAYNKQLILQFRNAYKRLFIEIPRNSLCSAIAKLFDVHPKTIRKYCVLEKKPQQLDRRCNSGRFTNTEFIGYLRTIFINEPTYYLRKTKKAIRNLYDTTISTTMIHYIRIRYLQFYRKCCTFLSRNRKLPRVIQSKQIYKKSVRKIPLDKLYFQDESHFVSSLLCRRYCCGPIGQEIIICSQRLDDTRYSLLSTIGWSGHVHSELIDNNSQKVDKNVFIYIILVVNYHLDQY